MFLGRPVVFHIKLFVYTTVTCFGISRNGGPEIHPSDVCVMFWWGNQWYPMVWGYTHTLIPFYGAVNMFWLIQIRHLSSETTTDDQTGHSERWDFTVNQVTHMYIHIYIYIYNTLVLKTCGIKQQTKLGMSIEGKLSNSSVPGRWADQTWVARQSPGAVAKNLRFTGDLVEEPTLPNTVYHYTLDIFFVFINYYFFCIYIYIYNNI